MPQMSLFAAENNDNQNYCFKYTGSTQTSYGYKPNCTFTIFKIKGNKFRWRYKFDIIEL